MGLFKNNWLTRLTGKSNNKEKEAQEIGTKGQATKEEIDLILGVYHRALNVDDYTYEELQADYARGLRMVLLNLTHTGGVELGDDRGKKMMDIWLERLSIRLEQAYQDIS